MALVPASLHIVIELQVVLKSMTGGADADDWAAGIYV